jgi:hypothetical protein
VLEVVAHLGGGVGVEAAHAGDFVAEALFGEDFRDAVPRPSRSCDRVGGQHQGLWALVLGWGIRIFGFCIDLRVWFMAVGGLFRA